MSKDPINYLPKTRRVLDRLTVGASEGSVLNSTRYFRSQGELQPKKLQELEHVLFIAWTFGVALSACLSGVLPIDVDAIEVVLGVGVEDVVDKGVPIGGCGHRLREIA